MNIHLIANEADADLLDSPFLQGHGPRLAHLQLPDLSGRWLLMDLKLDWEPGLELISQLRHAYPLLGIMVSGAGRDVQACVLGYERGADFFMNQPAMHEELMAAMHAQVRVQVRVQTRIKALAQSEFSGLPPAKIVVDGLRLQVRGPSSKICITTTEFKLFKAFVRSAGQVLTIEEIQNELDYGPKWHERPSRLSVLIYRMRRKLVEAGAEAKAIRSRRNLGYELVCPVNLIDPLDPSHNPDRPVESVLPLSFERRIVEAGRFEETTLRQ